jgi:transposase
VWNTARGGTGGRTCQSALFKGARWALWRDPNTLTDKRRHTLAYIQIINKPLHRAYLLKEQFRVLGGHAGKSPLKAWLGWAARCRIDAFVRLAKRIRHHLPASTRPSTVDCPTPASRPTTPT